MNDDISIPSIDLGAFNKNDGHSRNKTGVLVDEICREIGFLKITNHEIPIDTIENAWNAATEFFALSERQKNIYRPINPRSPRGYFPMQSETLTKSRGIMTPPDLKEAFSSGPLSQISNQGDDYDFFYGKNIWPEKPRYFKNAWIKYYQSMELLSLQIMRLFAVALNLDQFFFDNYYTHHISALRTLNYPAIKFDHLPDQERAGAHTDYGSLTILLPDPKIGGLEVKYKNGKWLPINPEENTFIINIGDMMARWTNDRWVSTLHRVTSPNKIKQTLTEKRQSIAYFQNPNFDAEIKCLPTCIQSDNEEKYQTIKAGEYLMNRFNATMKK